MWQQVPLVSGTLISRDPIIIASTIALISCVPTVVILDTTRMTTLRLSAPGSDFIFSTLIIAALTRCGNATGFWAVRWRILLYTLVSILVSRTPFTPRALFGADMILLYTYAL
jgi:hypothetical protein